MKQKLFFATLILISFTSVLQGQSIEGDWYSMLNAEGIEIRLNVHVRSTPDGYSATFDSPDQGAMGIPLSSASFTFPDFSFTHTGAGFKYEGVVDPSYTRITGTFSQGGQKFPLVFERDPVKITRGSIADIKSRYTKQEVYITMRDGKRLFTSIYRPLKIKGPLPVLLSRTPYNIEPAGPSQFSFFTQIYSRYMNDNYIIVLQDVRGRYMSEGAFEDIRPVIPEKKSNKDIDETTDTWDTVDWIIKNVEDNNGKVGIFGISYPGFYSTMGIINSHPAVKAVSPQAPVTAWFIGDDFHHNGAFFLLDCFSFYYSNGRVFHSPSRRGFPQFDFPPDNYNFFLSLGAIRNIAPKYFGDSTKFWNDAFNHPDYDEFWKSRDPRQHLKNVKPAVMTVGGWFDAEDLYGALKTYEAIEIQNPASVKNTLVMGPWSHSQWAFGKATNLGNIYWGMDANKDYIELEKRFFDFYLKGEGSGNIPEAAIFITGRNEWRNFETWPPKNMTTKNIYFQPAGEASSTVPGLKVSYDEYISDPMNPVPYTEDVHARRTAEYMTDDQRFASRRPDVLEYQTSVLEEDVTLAGPVSANLFVTTTGTDADFVVKLIDVFPDTVKTSNEEIKVPLGGYQMLVRGEVFRGRYRNSFEKPEAFVPGKITEVKYEIPDVAHTFKKGHRIMIQVQSSWFPLVDRNPQKFVDIYKCSDSDFQKATIRIYHDSKNPSHLKVGVLE
jgi:uncharacterized protein